MENQEILTCPICHEKIQSEDLITVCPDCHATYHQKCWESNHGCATPDCPQQNSVTSKEISPSVCPSCGAVLQEGQDFCPKCGQKVQAAQTRTCFSCGTILQDGQDFCPKCGQQYTAQNVAGYQNFSSASAFSPAPNPVAAVAIAPPVKKSKKKFVVIGIVGIIMIAVIVAAAILIPTLLTKQENFKEMFGQLEAETWCEIAPDGSWMRLDTNPDNYDYEDDLDYYFYGDNSDRIDEFYATSEAASSTIEQINERLGFSSGVYQRMNETTALQGRQTETHGRYTVSWTYHPDNGLEVLYEIDN